MLILPFSGLMASNLVRAEDSSRPVTDAIERAIETIQALQKSVFRDSQILREYERSSDPHALSRESRQTLADSLALIPRQQISNYIRQEMTPILSLASEKGIEIKLVPDPKSIQVEEPLTLPSSVRSGGEPAWIIILDIIIEALDITFAQEIVQRSIEADEELQNRFAAIVAAVTNHEWTTLAGLLDQLLSMIFTGEFLRRIYITVQYELGANFARRFARRSAKRLVLKLVPFVGWGYLVLSLGLAIKTNLHRFKSV